jgi:hypothetical protein
MVQMVRQSRAEFRHGPHVAREFPPNERSQALFDPLYPSRSGFRQQVAMNCRLPCYLKGMDELLLPLPEIAKLKAAHRHAKTRREADRIKAVVLLGKGWTPAESL